MSEAGVDRRHRGLRRIFAAPAAIAAFSLIGLGTALTGDGWHDILAWIALATPPLIVAWAWRRRSVAATGPRKRRE